ncbi:MAG: hypothetical protein ACI8RD_002643 [Bacillariaceae sp.]|jgi:hypothetical protein
MITAPRRIEAAPTGFLHLEGEFIVVDIPVYALICGAFEIHFHSIIMVE